MSDGPVVAFVPVDRGREHAASVLARSARWRVPGRAVEANTGVVAWRNATAARTLIDAWLRAYGDLADASGFLMDQPAFRAALHATRAPHAALPPRFNCRGHDRTRRAGTAVPLRARPSPKEPAPASRGRRRPLSANEPPCRVREVAEGMGPSPRIASTNSCQWLEPSTSFILNSEKSFFGKREGIPT